MGAGSGDDRATGAQGGELQTEWLRAALESLYDNASLAASPLCSHYRTLRTMADTLERAQALRSLLLDGIEALRPLQQGQAYAQAARDYEVLSLHYAAGMSIEQIAERLCVVTRQVYRDLRRGEEKLSQLLGNRDAAASSSPDADARQGAIQRETASLLHSQKTLDARVAVAAAISAVRPLAEYHSVVLAYDPPASPMLVHATPGVLRTALTESLSGAVQAAAPSSQVTVELRCPGSEPEITVTCTLAKAAPGLSPALDSARAAHLSPSLVQVSDDSYCLRMKLPGALPKRVLVIEDSDSACSLYKRYLEGSGWQVVCLADAQKAADLAHEIRPSAIVLDIMMPDLDGWTVLQGLRMDPATAATPIIVCSVVYDPGLASALGASAALAKPVSRLELVAALRQLTDH